MTGPIVVVKVGGSLLDWPGLPLALPRFLATLPGRRPVLVVGGGRFADILRDLDRAHQLGESRSHALALRALDLSARLLVEVVPGLALAATARGLASSWARGLAPVLAPRRFLDRDDRRPDPLPHAWTTTTDSIAARIAARLRADELILLKSTAPPDLDPATRPDLDRLAAIGLVDPEFPRAARSIPVVTIRDLRSQHPK